MTISFENLAILFDVIAGPAIVAGAVATYADWARKMRGRRAVQIGAIAIVAVALALDGADRSGRLWSSPLQIAARRDYLESEIVEKARTIDTLRAQNSTFEGRISALERQLAEKDITATSSLPRVGGGGIGCVDSTNCDIQGNKSHDNAGDGIFTKNNKGETKIIDNETWNNGKAQTKP
jgi:hypothetical protein